MRLNRSERRIQMNQNKRPAGTVTALGSREAAASIADAHAPGREPQYRYEIVKLAEAVDRCVAGDWDLPDFQREFVWTPDQLTAFADSIWRDYPTGFVMRWTPPSWDAASDRRALIADGQQRLTSLCFLFGVKPGWWKRRPDREWLGLMARRDVRFDVESDDEKHFVIGDRSTPASRFIPLPSLLQLNAESPDGVANLRRIAREIRAAGHCRNVDDAEVIARLVRVASMRDRPLLVTQLTHEFRDVMEIFDRLNSRGIRFRHLVIRTLRQAISLALGRDAMNREVDRIFRKKRSEALVEQARPPQILSNPRGANDPPTSSTCTP